jgi:ABC-2 type transport system ATP-binding protein/lipopolysaccharide transport system ATP-binding protein
MNLIELEDVGVDFVIYQGSGRSLRKSVLHAGTGGILSHDAHHRTFVRALSGISFSLQKGDRLGLIGHNGAGKSTLLRVLAGVYEPTRGYVRVVGQVMPLFDISHGFDMDATGYENILVRAAYLGLSRREIMAATDEIAEFTELGDYLDLPIRTYSAGMMLRLAFGVTTTVHSDVLLLDEWISAGDLGFLEKAQQRASNFVRRSNVLVLASHSKDAMQLLCNKVLWLDKGEIVKFGDVDEVWDAYEQAQGVMPVDQQAALPVQAV